MPFEHRHLCPFIYGDYFNYLILIFFNPFILLLSLGKCYYILFALTPYSLASLFCKCKFPFGFHWCISRLAEPIIAVSWSTCKQSRPVFFWVITETYRNWGKKVTVKEGFSCRVEGAGLGGETSLIISLRKLKPLLTTPPLAASHRASAHKWLHNLRNAGIFFLLSFLSSCPFISLFCFINISLFFSPIIIPSPPTPCPPPAVSRPVMIRFRDSHLRRFSLLYFLVDFFFSN